MYSLDCPYYNEEWSSLNELIDDVVSSGMDPNYEITLNGHGTGETLFEVIQIYSCLLSESFVSLY